MAKFSMTYKNSTGEQLWFGVYQNMREIPSLQSVVWYAVKALPQQQGMIKVQMQYGVGIGSLSGGTIRTEQQANANLGCKYQVMNLDGMRDISQLSGSVSSQEIELQNNTDSVLDLCFSAADHVICYMEAGPFEATRFVAQPTFYVAVYNADRSNILGGPVDDGIVAGPLGVEYKDGLAFECVFDNGAYILKALD